VVVVEDLISTGKSSLLAVDALREAGAQVKGMAAIFTYGFDVSVQNFDKAGVTLNTLSNYDNLLDLAVAKNYITELEFQTLQEWRKSPDTWGQ
jgi:orotate phosphoribosyltransferase